MLHDTDMSLPLQIALSGASGRMGLALIQALHEQQLPLTAALVHQHSKALGKDAAALAGLPDSGVIVSSDVVAALDCCHVLIDFSSPAATEQLLPLCAERGIALITGTTGFSNAQLQLMQDCAKKIPVVYSANFSVGVNLTVSLLQLATRIFQDSVDIEMIEAHHRHKVDAPSGTALMMGDAIAQALGNELKDLAVYQREGAIGARSREEIGFSTIRGGDIVGEHTVLFLGEGERVEVTHRASSRLNFVYGVIRALQWIPQQPAGLYDMRDVLGLAKQA